MHLQVEIKQKLNLWDWKICHQRLSVGSGQQSLRWLGHAACQYIAFEFGTTPSKCIPQGIKIKDELVDSAKLIKDVCSDGDHVVVEYSSGPESYTQCPEGEVSASQRRVNASLIRHGYDLGDDDDIYDVIKDVDALVARVVNLIYDVVEEIDTILHGPKISVVVDPSTGMPSEISTNEDVPIEEKPTEEEPVVNASPEGSPEQLHGNPIPIEEPPPDPPVDEETYMEIALSFFELCDYGIINLIKSSLQDISLEEAFMEFRTCREVLKGHDGQLQALLLYYSAKGVELHDKDFGVLTFDQWQQLWSDLKIPGGVLDSSLIPRLWNEIIHIDQISGSYQLDTKGFYATIIHLAAALYSGYGSMSELSSLTELVVAHFIEDIINPKFEKILMPLLQKFEIDDISRYMNVLKDLEDTLQDGLSINYNAKKKLEAEKVVTTKDNKETTTNSSNGSTNEDGKLLKTNEVEKPNIVGGKKGKKKKGKKIEKEPIVMKDKFVQADAPEKLSNLIPHFRNWKILGEIWNSEIAALAIIYALQSNLNLQEYQPLSTNDLSFGIIELKRFLLASSHIAYKKVPIKRVSEFSFFQTHLNESFQRGGIAKPLYSNYEQKKIYLASICLRYGGKPPPQPPVSEKK